MGQYLESIDDARTRACEQCIAMRDVNAPSPNGLQRSPRLCLRQSFDIKACALDIETADSDKQCVRICVCNIAPGQRPRRTADGAQHVAPAGELNQFRIPVPCAEWRVQPLEKTDRRTTRCRQGGAAPANAVNARFKFANQRPRRGVAVDRVADRPNVLEDIRERHRAEVDQQRRARQCCQDGRHVAACYRANIAQALRDNNVWRKCPKCLDVEHVQRITGIELRTDVIVDSLAGHVVNEARTRDAGPVRDRKRIIAGMRNTHDAVARAQGRNDLRRGRQQRYDIQCAGMIVLVGR